MKNNSNQGNGLNLFSTDLFQFTSLFLLIFYCSSNKTHLSIVSLINNEYVTVSSIKNTKILRALPQVHTCVWRSSPVTIFPTVRRAGMSTEGDG